MRTPRVLFIFFVIAMLASMLLPVQAQGPTPQPVGLRPDAPEYAKHGPFWVGSQDIYEKTASHQTTVTLWYPALNPKGVQDTVTLNTSQGRMIVHALQNAAPDASAGPYPLVIFVHSLDQQRFATIYLCEHLASQGFVVIAIDYVDNAQTPTWKPPKPFPVNLLLSRPRDVSWQIDYAQSLTASGGKLPGMIDTTRVAVVGHSFGGDTALVVGGGRLDASGTWCAEYPDAKFPASYGGTRMCDSNPLMSDEGRKELAALAGLDTVPKDLWPSWGDPRVSAIIAMDPFADTFGSEGTRTVKVPALVLVASKAEILHPEYEKYVPWVYDNLGSPTKSMATLVGANDPIFSNDCATDLDWIGVGYFWACSDPVWDTTRAHDLINHFTTAFLLDVLKGDKEAHKALLPDAVKFVGIDYKTTLK